MKLLIRLFKWLFSKKYRINRKYRVAHQELVNSRIRNCRKARIEHYREYIRNYMAIWIKKNHKKYRKYRREYTKMWCHNNKDKVREYNKRYIAKKQALKALDTEYDTNNATMPQGVNVSIPGGIPQATGGVQ